MKELTDIYSGLNYEKQVLEKTFTEAVRNSKFPLGPGALCTTRFTLFNTDYFAEQCYGRDCMICEIRTKGEVVMSKRNYSFNPSFILSCILDLIEEEINKRREISSSASH